MRQTWMFGVTLAALVAAPAFVHAQSTTTETKVELSKDQVSETTGKMTGTTKDAWLTAKTKIALYGDDRVSGSSINVDTQNATVMLRGKVSSADEKRAAEEVARSIDGVGTVKNEPRIAI